MTNTPPSSVRIGPFTYSIGPMQPMEGTKHGLFGWHHWPSLEIKYRSDANDQQIAQIILHEVLHGIWYTNKLDRNDEEKDTEEGYVEQLAISLCDVIRNNPRLIAWISQTLAGEGETFLQTARDVAPQVNIEVKGTREERVADYIERHAKTVYVNDKPTLWA